MSTKFFSDGEVHSYFNPYDTPYEAFINFMNVLSDFEIRVNAAVDSKTDDDIARLSKIIKEKDEQLEKLEKLFATKQKPAPSRTAATKTPSKTKSTSTGKATTEKKATVKKQPAAAKKSAGAKTTADARKRPTDKKS